MRTTGEQKEDMRTTGEQKENNRRTKGGQQVNKKRKTGEHDVHITQSSNTHSGTHTLSSRVNLHVWILMKSSKLVIHPDKQRNTHRITGGLSSM